ncbi:hypothetical protein HU200_060065 [Digitaria exilis]|uniref:Cation/H+ exchanger transmembrane domain-containing protein n=1 Tax=Digitaria exilis TaxID=1010633 RepID=A0A835A793_9POAL|nr:hypothetical protein HU200_060065 [Digitaria exilis]
MATAAAWWEALVAAAAVNGGATGSSTTVVSICVFTTVLCVCLVAGHLLEENKWVNESITALIIGCIIGAIIFLLTKGKNSHILRFDEQLFFIYVLPPIIFNAGFQVKKKQFFHNFMTIMSFGVFGVFISVAIVSAGCYWLFPKVGFGNLDAVDYLALGAIFSSTDTVCTLQVINQDETPRLYSLVFGEGVVNDATAVVLFNAIKNLNISRLKGGLVLKVISDFLYLFATSTILGISIGLSTAYVLKALYLGRHSTDREVALMALMAYLSYMLAELLELSGILTVFFCGIVMSHYAWHNVTASSRITTKHIFATLSFIAETFIFLYVGMDALDIDKWKTSKASFKTSISLFGIIILLVLLGRAAFVCPISILSNNMSGSSERTPITFKHQVVIWWAGLMRGAVSIALAYNQFTFSGETSDPVHAAIITSTIIVVFFTTLVFGFLTRPLISAMLPRHSRAPSRGHSTGTNSPKDDFTLPFFSTDEDASGSGIVLEQAKRSISMLLERPVHTVHIYWRKFDDKFMRPIFGGPQSH